MSPDGRLYTLLQAAPTIVLSLLTRRPSLPTIMELYTVQPSEKKAVSTFSTHVQL